MARQVTRRTLFGAILAALGIRPAKGVAPSVAQGEILYAGMHLKGGKTSPDFVSASLVANDHIFEIRGGIVTQVTELPPGGRYREWRNQ